MQAGYGEAEQLGCSASLLLCGRIFGTGGEVLLLFQANGVKAGERWSKDGESGKAHPYPVLLV